MTAIVALLNTPLFRTRSEKADDDREERPKGIVLQPWMISLLIALVMNLITMAVMWGTVITRLDAQDQRLQRLERQKDNEEKTRGALDHSSPPIIGIGGSRGAQP